MHETISVWWQGFLIGGSMVGLLWMFYLIGYYIRDGEKK